MEQRDRDALRRNRPKLVIFFASNQPAFGFVCDELLKEGILSDSLLAYIRCQSDEYGRVRCFLDTLPRRGPDGMTAFLKALDLVAATDIIDALLLDERMDVDDPPPPYPPPPYPPPTYPPPTYEQAMMETTNGRDESDVLTKYVITSRDCIEISGKIGSGWEMLAVHLNLSSSVVDRIKMDNVFNCRKAIQSMLETWRAASGGGIASDLMKANKGVYAFDPFDVETYLRSRAEEAYTM